MSWGRRLGAAGLLAPALPAVLASASALAYFTTTGAGSASIAVLNLAPPSIVAATPSVNGSVALSWTAVTPPGGGNVSYTVTRDGDDAGGTCKATLAETACVDAGLDVGSYEYVVTARWRSWTAHSGGRVANVVEVADHLVISVSSTTPAVGASDNLTITAKDAAGHTVTGYTGSHNLTFSGAATSPSGKAPTVANSSGTAVAFGNPTALNFSSGVASVSSSKTGR